MTNVPLRRRQLIAVLVVLVMLLIDAAVGYTIGELATHPVAIPHWPQPCPWGGVLVVDRTGRVVDVVCWRMFLLGLDDGS